MLSRTTLKLLCVLAAGAAMWGGYLLVRDRNPVDGVVATNFAEFERANFVEPKSNAGILDERTARQLFPALRQERRNAYDPIAHVVRVPSFHGWRRFEEHPQGGFEIVSNNLGFREDRDTEVTKKDLRIFVTGDSHIEGVVATQESYPHVLERVLDARYPGRDFEILNMAVGATGPYSYLGMFEKHLALEPDLLISTCFLGNDFWGALEIADVYHGRARQRADRAYRERLFEAQQWPLSQGFNQAYRFKHFPAEKKLALDAALDAFTKMAERCREKNVGFLVVLLPTKADVDFQDDRTFVQETLRILEMTPEEYAVNLELGDELAKGLEAEGVAVVDAAPLLRAATVPTYWREDQHLNVAGHKLLGEGLEEPVLRALERAGRSLSTPGPR